MAEHAEDPSKTPTLYNLNKHPESLVLCSSQWKTWSCKTNGMIHLYCPCSSLSYLVLSNFKILQKPSFCERDGQSILTWHYWISTLNKRMLSDVHIIVASTKRKYSGFNGSKCWPQLRKPDPRSNSILQEWGLERRTLHRMPAQIPDFTVLVPLNQILMLNISHSSSKH